MKRLSRTARFLVMASALSIGSCFLLRSVSPRPQALQVRFLYTTRDSDGTRAWLDIENRQHDPVSIPSAIFLEKRTRTWKMEKATVLETDRHAASFAPGTTTMVAASLPTAPGRYRFVLVIDPTNSRPSYYENARRRLAEFLAGRHAIDYKTWHRMQGSTVLLSEAFDVSPDTPPKVQQ